MSLTLLAYVCAFVCSCVCARGGGGVLVCMHRLVGFLIYFNTQILALTFLYALSARAPHSPPYTVTKTRSPNPNPTRTLTRTQSEQI